MAWHSALSRKNKYNAKRTEYAGHTFDSGGEAEMYGLLLLREKAGEIKNIRRQVSMHLAGAARFKVDFVVFEIKRGIDVAVEFKGLMQERFRLIMQLWPALGEMPLQIWMKKGNRIFMHKELQGKSLGGDDNGFK